MTDVKVLARIPKAADCETHVRLIDIDGVLAVEFRDFILSLGQYGRGYWVPYSPTGLDRLAAAVAELAIDSATAAGES